MPGIHNCPCKHQPYAEPGISESTILFLKTHNPVEGLSDGRSAPGETLLEMRTQARRMQAQRVQVYGGTTARHAKRTGGHVASKDSSCRLPQLATWCRVASAGRIRPSATGRVYRTISTSTFARVSLFVCTPCACGHHESTFAGCTSYF